MRDRAAKNGESLLFPTTCWYCGQEIYLFASPFGGFAIFDSVGIPWPKHSCAGVSVTDRQYSADRIDIDVDGILPISFSTTYGVPKDGDDLTGVVADIIDETTVELYDGKQLFVLKLSRPLKIGKMIMGRVSALGDVPLLDVVIVYEPSKADVKALVSRIPRRSQSDG